MKIGNVVIKNPIVLAPMAGISNPSYIKICEEMGVGYAITELISSEAIIRNNKKTFDMLNGISELNIPVAVQIFGSSPKNMAESAKILVDKFNIKIIDINMGCPVPKVAVKSQAGSSLLKDLNKIYEVVSAVVNAVEVPVTVKIRSGWDFNSINAKEVAKVIESAGASAITVHPRTRAQGYSGKADWNIIKEVKESVTIPVIGNGDIKSCYDAKSMMELTGCDAVMIGRAALGNPWIIKQTLDYLNGKEVNENISLIERINMIKKHFDLLMKYKNDKLAILEIRTNAAWYLKSIKDSKELKQEIFKAKTKEQLYKLLDEFITKHT